MPLRLPVMTTALLIIAGCASQRASTACIPASEWTRAAQDLTPGDQVQVIVHAAPELSGTLTVAPDGRIHMPLIGPVQAQGRNSDAIERELMAALEGELRDPTLAVIPLPATSTPCTTP